MLHFIKIASIRSLKCIYSFKMMHLRKRITPWLGQFAHQKGQFAQDRHLTPTAIFYIIALPGQRCQTFNFLPLQMRTRNNTIDIIKQI